MYKKTTEENWEYVKATTDKLLDITYNNDDWEYVQNECLSYIDDENLDVAQLAIICLGHVFTFHGLIDKEKVLPVLYKKMKDKEMTGVVEDALDDMGDFI